MEVTVCIGSSCHLKGARDVVRILERLIAQNHLENSVSLKGSFCMGECAESGVCVRVNEEGLSHVAPAEAESFFNLEIRKRLKESQNG